MNIVLVCHYYPPANNTGAKRFTALSKNLVKLGHAVTVITTTKRPSDGQFSEVSPEGVSVIEVNRLGRPQRSRCVEYDGTAGRYEALHDPNPSFGRLIKNWAFRVFGQLPDPRLPFALSFLSPFCSKMVISSIRNADVVVATSPPWTMLLAAIFIKTRFRKKVVLDYRDHFSECHAMPGTVFAKSIERILDRKLCGSADGVVTVSGPMTDYYQKYNSTVRTIYNGYDNGEMAIALRAPRRVLDGRVIVVRYLGTVSPGRIPRNFISAIREMNGCGRLSAKELRVEFYGNCQLLSKYIAENFPDISVYFHFLMGYLTLIRFV